MYKLKLNPKPNQAKIFCPLFSLASHVWINPKTLNPKAKARVPKLLLVDPKKGTNIQKIKLLLKIVKTSYRTFFFLGLAYQGKDSVF